MGGGEIDALLPLVGDADGAGDDVRPAAAQHGDEGVEGGLGGLQLHAQLLGDEGYQLHLQPQGLAAAADIAHGLQRGVVGVPQDAVGGVIFPHVDGLYALVSPQPFLLQGLQRAVLRVPLNDGAHLVRQRAVLLQPQAVAVRGHHLGKDHQLRLPRDRQLGDGHIGHHGVQRPRLQRQQQGGEVVVILELAPADHAADDVVKDAPRQHPNGGSGKILERLEAGCGLPGAGHHRHDAAGVVGLGEVHALRALLRHRDAGGGHVVGPGAKARENGGELRADDLQPVAIGPAEAGHDVDVVAHDLPVLDVAEGGHVALHRHAYHAVFGGEGSPVLHHLFVLIRPQPDGVDLFQGAVCADLGQKFVVLVPQGRPPLGLGEGGGIALLHQDVGEIGHRRVFLAQEAGDGFVHQKAGDLPLLQGQGQVGHPVVVLLLRVPDQVVGVDVEAGAGHDPDGLAVQLPDVGDGGPLPGGQGGNRDNRYRHEYRQQQRRQPADGPHVCHLAHSFRKMARSSIPSRWAARTSSDWRQAMPQEVIKKSKITLPAIARAMPPSGMPSWVRSTV